MSEDQGGAGTRIFRAGARRLGSTGTLGRRALWADGPTGRAGPELTSRRASEAEEEAEEASGGRPRLNLKF